MSNCLTSVSLWLKSNPCQHFPRFSSDFRHLAAFSGFFKIFFFFFWISVKKEKNICEIPTTFGQVSARIATKIGKQCDFSWKFEWWKITNVSFSSMSFSPSFHFRLHIIFVTKNCWIVDVGEVQRNANLIDLVKSFQTSIYLQNFASIQPRTSHLIS